MNRRIIIDAREFAPGKTSGISRFLEGLVGALADSVLNLDIILASFRNNSVPMQLFGKRRTSLNEVPSGLLASEKVLSDLTRTKVNLLLSPYPKLPMFGSSCPAINTVHDILDLTHPAYRKRFRTIFDRFRLYKALKQASLTWYVSEWTLRETRRYLGMVGKNPKVRHSGIDPKFQAIKRDDEHIVLNKYQLETGYVLVIGNGLPHKNLDVLLKIANDISRQLVFVGMSDQNRKYWQSRYQNVRPRWMGHVKDEDLPAIIRAAFCLAQPSTAEGYGYPPLEAMACGIPCVVSNIPVLKETTGGNALYADPNSSREWIEAFQSFNNNTTYQSQIEKGLKWVEPLSGIKAWNNHLSDIKELLNIR